MTIIDAASTADFSGNGEVTEESTAEGDGEDRASPDRRRIRELFRGASVDEVAERLDRARSLLSGAGGEVITQLRLSPHETGASVERVLSPRDQPLSRQERRRLQKKLKRAKGLA